MFEPCDPTAPPASPKRLAVLKAAAALFTTQGYGAVSMEAVAKEAGVSKATLYAHFTGKDALFAEMMTARVQAVHPAQSMALHDAQPRQTLPVIGRRWLSFMLAPEAMAIFRIVVAEGARFPDLAQAFYAAGPGKGMAWCSAWIAEEIRLGRLRGDTDPAAASSHLIGLLRGDLYLRSVLALVVPTEAEIGAVVDSATDTFLRAYGA